MKKIRPIILLFGVIFIGAILRLYIFGSVPASINWDEAALGYNAYSILETGKDEYGNTFPLILRSFDDYKPALYSYLIVPLIPIFDLTEMTVRLPSALAGISGIVIIYFLILKIFGSEIVINNYVLKTKYLALLTSFFFSISPWSIQFSRIAFESNVGLTINLLVLLLFLYGLKRPWLLILSFALGALNIHMYQSDRVFTPLLLLVASIIYYKDILKIKSFFVISIIIAALIASPFFLSIFFDENALLRARGVSIFSDQTHLLEKNVEKLIFDNDTNNYLGKVLDNRRVEYLKLIISGYVAHFNLNWLFISGDIARHHAPYMGLLYLANFPFLFIGIYQLIFGRFRTKAKLLIFGYFLLVPIPASITSGVPHAVRTLNFIPIFDLFVAIGLIASLIFLYKFKTKVLSSKILVFLFVMFYIVVFCINFIYYLNQYFVQQNYYHSKDWLYGYKDAIDYANSIDSKYDQVIVSNEPPLDQSYIFFLFYKKIDPTYYLSTGGTKTGGFEETHEGFYNYKFKPIGNTDDYDANTLFIGRDDEIKNTPLRILKEITHPDGSSAIIIADK